MSELVENKMGTQPVTKLIVSMSLPAMFSMLVNALYNVVDSVFVSWASNDALTALSLAFPVQMLMISVGIGTGVGINSLVSRRLGEKNQEEADHAASHGVVLALISWAVFALLGILFTRPFFAAFTQTQAVVDMGCDYVRVITICSFGMFVEINLEKTLQATGNMIYPMFFQLTGCIINIILDPIMIFGLLGFPKLGVLGAAIATVIGQICAMIFAAIVIFKKSHAVNITLKNFKFRAKTVKDIYIVGLPSIVMQSIGSVLIVGLNAILIKFSEAAVSVLGIYNKVQSFVFMPVFGLTQGVMPIMGYNYGARKKKRLLKALKVGSVMALCIMAVGTLIFMLLPAQILQIFNATPEMMRIGILAMRIISLNFIPAALGILFSTLFQAVGLGTRSLLISLLRQLVVLLPVAYALSFIGLESIWYAFPISEAVSLVVSILLLIQVYRKYIKNLEPEPQAV